MSKISTNMPTQPVNPSQPSSILLNNQNLLHVKFHVNKIQENLLSKRLKQLNEQEMKLRLKNQRTSNDLVNFLNDCKQSTGYLSKMKLNRNTATSTLDSLEQKSSICSMQSKDHILESNTSSSFDMNYISPVEEAKTIKLSRPKINRKFCFKSLDFEKNSTQIEQINNELFRIITPLKSLPETAESVAESSDLNEHDISEQKIGNPSLFEQILSRSETDSTSTPTSTQFNCSNSSHNNLCSSKASASSRSNCSDCSSRDLQCTVKRQESVNKTRPSSCSTAKSIPKYFKSKFSDSTTLSNIDWLASTFTFDLNLDRKTTVNSIRNEFDRKSSITSSNFRIAENKKKTRQKSFKKSEFKSRSLNILLNSTSFKTNDYNTESSLSSFFTNDSNKSKLSITKSIDSKYHTRKSLMNQQQVFPIQINMSRNLIRKKQVGLINDYKNLNSMEFIKSLRQIQKNLDTKVKQFSHKTIQQAV